jgi:hypothetical protein
VHVECTHSVHGVVEVPILDIFTISWVAAARSTEKFRQCARGPYQSDPSDLAAVAAASMVARRHILASN